MDAGTLHQAIVDAGCPVTSTTVGKPDDRATWSFVPDPSATQAQIDIGNNVIATIPIDPLGQVSASDFIARFTNAEYLALEKKRRDDVANNKVGNAKNWDIVIGDTPVDMNKKKVKTLKADLVTDGVLTQARADEIFA
jgi:hypothetical protein